MSQPSARPVVTSAVASRAARCLAALLSVALVAGGLASCGGAANEAPRSPSGAGAPGTLDEALAGLDRAEGELDAVFPRASSGVTPGYAQAPGATAAQPPSAPPPPSPATPPAEASPAPGGSETELASDPCAVACRALASMGRAAEHICGLAGESDGRCGTARQRVQAASQRVHAQCGCQP